MSDTLLTMYVSALAFSTERSDSIAEGGIRWMVRTVHAEARETAVIS